MNVSREQIAKLCHELNRAWCEVNGDFSQVPWEKASESIKNSAINGVEFILANPDLPPCDSHVNWYEYKKAEGWVYGEVKDEVKKTHPCMVPYNDLPEIQRIKDSLFRSTVLNFVK